MSGLVLLVDDAEKATPEELRALLVAWQHMQSESPALPAALFIAGGSAVQSALVKAAPFAERFVYRELRSLDADAVRVALVTPAAVVGVRWAHDAVEAATELSAGHPAPLQSLAGLTWSVASPAETITVEHVREAWRRLADWSRSSFDRRFRQATNAERRFMTVMAGFSKGAVRRADIVERLRRDASGDMSMVRESLVRKGLIRPAGRGVVEFALPGFADFILRETANPINQGRGQFR